MEKFPEDLLGKLKRELPEEAKMLVDLARKNDVESLIKIGNPF